jgi:hypothetical protein
VLRKQKILIVLLSIVICLGLFSKQITLLQDVYADEPTLSTSAQIEADNNIEVNEPALLIQVAPLLVQPHLIITRFIPDFYLQPASPPPLRPPLV